MLKLNKLLRLIKPSKIINLLNLIQSLEGN
jgi:hypothetical protein